MRKLLDFWLPTHCALCKLPSSDAICHSCTNDYLIDLTPRCQTCALPIFNQHDAVCGKCLRDPPFFNASLVCINYQVPIDSLVLGLKFAAKLANAGIMAQHLATAVQRQQQRLASAPNLVCPVPLSQQRLRTRGFNQAWEIARPLSRYLAIPSKADLLWRSKETLQQSSLHPDERHKNVQGAFTVNPAWQALIVDQHIAIVDDVITTGTTLNEIAKVLKRYGAAYVSNFVFARTNWH